jgi:hypothetical protein
LRIFMRVQPGETASRARSSDADWGYVASGR